MSDSMNKWLNDAGRYPRLSEEQTIYLSRRIQTTEGKARIKAINKLCLHNLRLVVNTLKPIARKRNVKMSSELALDLLQLGYLGLRRACEKYDPSRGYKFSTYAVPWIRQGIWRQLNFREGMIYIPEPTMREAMYQHVHGKPSKMNGTTRCGRSLRCAERAMFVGSIDICMKI